MLLYEDNMLVINTNSKGLEIRSDSKNIYVYCQSYDETAIRKAIETLLGAFENCDQRPRELRAFDWENKANIIC